jgi:hypothetical protein
VSTLESRRDAGVTLCDVVLFGVVIVLFSLMPPAFGWSGESHWPTSSTVVVGGARFTAVFGWR